MYHKAVLHFPLLIIPVESGEVLFLFLSTLKKKNALCPRSYQAFVHMVSEACKQVQEQLVKAERRLNCSGRRLNSWFH